MTAAGARLIVFFVREIDHFQKGMDALRKAAESKKSATITPEQAAEIINHVTWLSNERESLISEYSAYDDD